MEVLTSQRLILEPLVVAHADALFETLRDPALYRYLDSPPPSSLEELRGTYARLEARKSPDGRELWLNWVIRAQHAKPIGYVQATVVAPRTAWIAYLIGREHSGLGHATEATQLMLRHLGAAYDVSRFLATVEAENLRSIRLLERLGFRPATPRESRGHELTSSERLFVGTSTQTALP